MFRPIIPKLASKPLQGFFRSSFQRSTPFTSSLVIAPVAKRFATHHATARIARPVAEPTNWPKIAGQVAIIGGTALGLNAFFNRETREGGIPAIESSYLRETFQYVAAGLGITAVAARALHLSGWSVRLMSMNPWVALGGGLVLAIGNYFCF